jgi:hypothetical protein
MFRTPLVIFELTPSALKESHPGQVVGYVHRNAIFGDKGAHGQSCVCQIDQVNLVFKHLQCVTQFLAQQLGGDPFVCACQAWSPLDGNVPVAAGVRRSVCTAAHQHRKCQIRTLRQHGLRSAVDRVDGGRSQAHGFLLNF